MRKNRLIALIGTLTMAAAGLAAVSAGVSSKKATMLKASSDQTYTLFGDHNGWNANDTTNQFKWSGSQYELLDVALSANNCFRIVKPSDTNMQWAGWSQCKDTTNFVSAGSDNNIKTKNAGRYNFYFKDWEDGSGNWNPIYVDKASYSVTLNKNGGSISSGSDITGYQYGETKTLPTLTKSGCTFNGWYDNETFTGSPVTQISATDHGNKEFWAKFTDSRVDPSSTLKTYYVVDHGGISENSTFYVYGFGEPSTVKPMTWPGKTGSDDAYAKLIADPEHPNQKVYKVDLSESYSKLILNNNSGKQTVNIEDLSDHVGDVIHISTTTDGEGHYNYEWLNHSELDIANGYWIRDDVSGEYLTHLELDPSNNQQYVGQVTLEVGDKFKVVNRIDFKLYSDQYYGYSALEDYAGSARRAGQLAQGSSDSIEVTEGNAGTYTIYHKFNNPYESKNAIPALVKHSVTYSGGTGATGTAPKQADVAEGVDFEVASNTFEKNGYSFVNWSDGNDTYDAGDPYTMGTSNVTLTAQWSAGTYEVELDNGDGSGDSSVTATFDADMPDVTVPELTDNDFCGYYTGSNGTGVKYYDEFGKSAHKYNDLSVTKLYAKWESSVVRHTVTFVSDNTDYGTVDVPQLSVVDGTPVTVDDNKIIIGDTTITATPVSGKGDHYIYEFKSWYSSGYLAEIPETIDDDYEFTATFIRKGEPHTITFINTDERGGSYPITQKYDPEGYDVTESVINQYTGGNPLGRTYVGLKLDATDPDETPFKHVVWDDDYEYYICYAFNDAACYEYSFDGNNFYPFTSHRDFAVGEPGYLQVYCVDGVNVTSGDTLTVRYRENEQSAYQTLTLDIDQNSNLAANGKVRNTALNTYLNVRFIYNESTQSYSYEATLGGMPNSGHWLSIDGILYQVEQNPSNPDELQVLNVSIGNNQIVKMYYGQTGTWYTCSLDPASQGTWTAVADGLQCGEPRAYNVYIKQSTPGNYDVLYFGYSQLTPEEEANQYAAEFVKTLNETDGLCKIAGYDDKGNPIYEVNMTQLQSFWKNHADAFEDLSSEAQGYLKAATPDQSEEASTLGKFAWSYQYTYIRYGKNFASHGGDFLEKGYTPSASRQFSVSNVSTSTWIIAAVAVVGIAAIGVFFIYRKRKEN